MQHRRLLLLGLSLFIMMGICNITTETGAQIYHGPLGDYWGSFGGPREKSYMTRDEAIAREGGCPTGGCVLKLDQVGVRPSRAHKGDTLTLTTSYTILTPEQMAMPVTITREIFFAGKSLGKTKSMDSNRLNGSWTQEVDFTLPADARPGVYTLLTTVTTGYGAQQKEVTFEIY